MSRHRFAIALAAPVAAAGALAQPLAAQAVAQPAQASPVRATRVTLNVSFLINGAPAGDVPVETDTAGNAAVNVGQLVARIANVVDPTVVDAVLQRAAGRDIVSVEELNGADFALAFSIARLQLTATVSTAARAVQTLSIADRTPNLVSAVSPPANPAAGVTVFLGQRFTRVSRQGMDRQPFTALAEGFANVGGTEGVNLRFQTGYEEGRALARTRTTLFHDDPDRAIRYSAGDIDPQAFGSFSPATSIVGLGFERLYQEIQPFRNIRPSGQGSLLLERPSRVDVLVNGALYRTINLTPGRYDLRDFPFLDGLNDVRLVVQDDAGRQESVVVSFFSDATLLEPGLSIYSATLGFPRTAFGPFVNSRYRDNPTFNGFYQRGVTDQLTLGGGIQADRRNALLVSSAVVGSRVGTFGVEAAFDASARESAQWAGLVSYHLNLPTRNARLRTVDAQLRFLSARFSPMFEAGVYRNPYSAEANVRVQSPLDSNMYATLAAGYSRARDKGRDLTNISAGLSRTFGRSILSANYLYRHDRLGGDHRAILSLSIPISTRHSARASYDTLRNRARLDYDIEGLEELDSTRARFSVGRSDGGQEGFAELEHYANRFRATARHDVVRENGDTQQTTDLAVAFGLGFADGQFALGREAGRGFVIVDGHQTLEGAPILVRSRSTLGPVARSGALGPALVPLRRGYRPESLEVEIPDLRPGYDIGPGRLDIAPGATSGYRWLIGSAASNIVVGRLVSKEGASLRFLSGTFEPISGKEARAVPFFTNKTGRMVAQRVAPGRYSIMLAGNPNPIGEVVVPDDARGPVQVGEIVVDGESR